MTLIGIAGSALTRVYADPFYFNRVSYTRQGFVNALHELGHEVIILPIDKPENAEKYISLVDKILLTGGQDVDPRFYHEEPHYQLDNVYPARDAFEIALIHEAIKKNKAVFGVCRGLQIMNVALGGSLYQSIKQTDSTVKHMQTPTPQYVASHSVKISPDSLLSFLPETYYVNSFHHQAVKELSPELTAIAKAADGLVEAVQNKEKRLLAVQWHPELTYHEPESQDFELFKYFAESL
ncbi:MAG: gamma-glutamyl-gamma-aminobutyrate hydrolase family protein [Streptococcaceae bacterium]|jgi:putative glutamine amidotransferase|nr:gamma-glutamyl-gamma-aminobutyrate hydrolase family protein [Streptococcaceae bacterium]